MQPAPGSARGTSLKEFTPNHTGGVTPSPRWAQPGNGLPGDEGRGLGGEGCDRDRTKIPRIQRVRYWTSQEHLTGLHHKTTLELGQGAAVCGLEHRAEVVAVDIQGVIRRTHNVRRQSCH